MADVEIILDRSRTLKYRWADLRDLSQRLGRASLAQILSRLAEAEPEAISWAILMGLRHEDKKITLEKVDDMIQAHFERGGRIADLLNVVLEGINASGIVRVPKEEAADRPT
jgi:CHASE2 domain-containing sensor protein